LTNSLILALQSAALDQFEKNWINGSNCKYVMQLFSFTLLLFFCMIVSTRSSGQEIIYGTNNYIEYQKGTLPIVISVPHGGKIAPSSIPDRTCNNAETVTDINTIELARSISYALNELTGCYPSIIICNLRRSKIDCNRNIEDGACGNEEAVTAWNEFNNFVNEAQRSSQEKYKGNTFYVDLHGHAHPIARVELGYLLYGSELRLPDDTLNKTKFINYSSIKDLAKKNANNYTHAELLRGDFALGTLLGELDYPSVPSRQIPYPLAGEGYFNGGYNVANHTSYLSGSKVNGVQMECYYEGIRDTKANRDKFGRTFASVLLDYLGIHRNVEVNECSTLRSNSASDEQIMIFPNPVKRLDRSLHISGIESIHSNYFLHSIEGTLQEFGEIKDNHIFFKDDLYQHLYILTIQNAQSTVSFKLMVE
jgi:hypothetical protein